jgi:general secretion pathway protein F
VSVATEPGRRRVSYAYRARRADGALEVGALDAHSPDEVRMLLTARGLFAEAVDAPDADRAAVGRMRPEHLAAGLHLLSSLLGAGLPLERALTVLMQIAPTGWRPEVLEGLLARTREGERTSDALHEVVADLPPFVRGLVAAGDANGALSEGLARAAEELEAANAARAALRAALAYPALLAFTGSIAIGILVGVVIPRFAGIIADLGQSLPLSTQIVLGGAELIRRALIPTVLAVVGSLILWRRWIDASAAARVRSAELLLALPAVGRVRAAAAGARVTATLGALLATRVPIAAALGQSGEAAGDAAIAHRLGEARERVLAGETLSRALDLSRAVPSSTVQLLRAGEATGDVAAMLLYAARLDRERTRTELTAMVRLVEPAMILLFGGIVSLVAAALLQAVYAVRPVA